MKKNYIFIVFITILALVTSSCKDKLFDFNLQSIDSEGEWGFPVINRALHTSDLFHNIDSLMFFNNSNGTLTFVSVNEIKNAVSLSDLFKIENQTVDTAGVALVTNLPNFDILQVVKFNLNTPDFALKYAQVKSGALSITFNITQANFSYSAVLTSNNIRTPQGGTASWTFNNTQHTLNLNFSDYVFEPDENGDITFTAHITVPTSTTLNQVAFNCHVELNNFAVHSVRGQFNAISRYFDSKTAFNLRFNQLQFNEIIFHDGKISIFSKNDLCRIDGTMNNLWLSGFGIYHPLISNPIPFSIPNSTLYELISDISLPSLTYIPNIDTLNVQCNLNVNPQGFSAGDIVMNENSSMHLKFKTELPSNLSIQNAVYYDTLVNALHDQFNFSDPRSMEKLTLRMDLTNAFPFELTPEIFFVEGGSGSMYKLNTGEVVISQGSPNAPYQYRPIYVELPYEEALHVTNAEKIILKFKMNTRGRDIEITDSQFVNIYIGAKIKYSSINM